jgi:hypothetical protein
MRWNEASTTTARTRQHRCRAHGQRASYGPDSAERSLVEGRGQTEAKAGKEAGEEARLSCAINAGSMSGLGAWYAF